MDGVSLTPEKVKLNTFRQVLPEDFSVLRIKYAKIEIKTI